jgi:glycosyltransferase involved in cell wall biosynthesis
VRVLYDLASPYAGRSAVHGGGVYGVVLFRQILERLPALAGRLQLDVATPEGGLPDASIAESSARLGLRRIAVSGTSDLADLIKGGGYDVYYSALPYGLERHLGPREKGSTRLLGTIHGLRPLELPIDRYYRAYLRNPLSKVRTIVQQTLPSLHRKGLLRDTERLITLLDRPVITVSEHTKYQMLTQFDSLASSDFLVAASFEEHVEEVSKTVHGTAISDLTGGRPFFLLVSCDRPAKNALRVLEAFETRNIPAKDRFAVVCVGFRPHQRRMISRAFPQTAGQIVHLPYLPREEVNALYSNAFCFVFPSLSEGFGYPPLEAMRYGTPVTASAHTAVPEVCRDAALYFDPLSVGEIASRISRIIVDQELRDSLARKGRERYRAFSATMPERVDTVLSCILNQ